MARAPRLPRLLAARAWLATNWRARNLAAALVAWLTMGVASQTATYRLVEGRAFDLASTLWPARPAVPGAVIVAIDEPSFDALGLRWPWPRDVHARLVESLRRAGAKAIGLDVLFAEPSSREADASLSAVMGPDVVLSAVDETIVMEQGVQVSRVLPLPDLMSHGAAFGLTNVELDGDASLRRMPPSGESFVGRLLAVAGAPAPTPPEGARIQYFGPARSYPTISYYQALEPEKYLPPGRLRGQIVLVGLSLSSPPRAESGGADAFATPFTVTSQTLTAGVEAHATILDNLSLGLSIATVGQMQLLAATLVAALLAALASGERIRWRSVVAAIALGAGWLGGSWLLLRFGRTWVPPVLPIGATTGVFAICFGLDHWIERRLRAAVSDAFSRYVAPELVDELAANPASLKLGGQRRTMTILFCDVRGFTALSERMQEEPERLAAIVNRLLDALSAEVLAHRGTIDKYMGDCVMAFWNAPLPDADHAVHAVEAALGMMKAVARVNDELGREFGETAPSLSVGVGVNTGDCLVGNLGSRWRYDYSVLGDAVNLAARLESQTKDLGEPILVGEATAARVGPRLDLHKVGSVQVRGRQAPVAVYGIVSDASSHDDIGG